jgi:hypothetical protein
MEEESERKLKSLKKKNITHLLRLIIMVRSSTKPCEESKRIESTKIYHEGSSTWRQLIKASMLRPCGFHPTK